MSNALTDIAIPRPSPDKGKAFRLRDYFSDLLEKAVEMVVLRGGIRNSIHPLRGSGGG